MTSEYLDHKTRLKTKKEIESRYLQLLKSASKVADILSIEKELGTIRTEIESTEVQLKSLKDRVQYSTVYFDFYKQGSAPELFSDQVGSAFVEGWDNLRIFSVILISVWPFLLAAAVLCFFLIRKARKRWRTKRLREPSN